MPQGLPRRIRYAFVTQGLLLILAIDHFLDMGRTATNVIGNAVAASVVAKWEGGFDPREPAEARKPNCTGTRTMRSPSRQA